MTGSGSSAARRSSSRNSASAPANGANDTGAIRAWAGSNGYEVNSRGRIKKEIVDAYEAANS